MSRSKDSGVVGVVTDEILEAILASLAEMAIEGMARRQPYGAFS